MEKRWVFKRAENSTAVQDLSSKLNVTPVLADLLVQRGVDTFDKAKAFFRPELSDLHDPMLMKDMDKAVERVERALGDGEKILVYGDYDVDGTTAVSLIYEFFSKYSDQLDYYIPDRYKEGYGVSKAGIDHAAANGFGLIIALDCGIKALDKVAYANEKGVDFIICDHHRPGDELPAAYAVLDPKRADCEYPYKELSGCGVGFKLVQAFAARNEVPDKEWHVLLDLLAVSIAADIVPISGENRVLAFHGLQRINSEPRTGIRAIIDVAQGSGEYDKPTLNITDVVFMIAPRINAAGRMDTGRKAVELLISGDDGIARSASKLIDEDNRTRRELDATITDEALEMIANDDVLRSGRSTVVFKPGWHKGVIGIVASRLIETHYKPTIVLTENEGMATGSARSVRGFDVYEAIAACSDLLEQFGGHMYAAGLTMKVEHVEEFQRRFEEVVSDTITEDQLVPEVDINAELSLDQIDDKFVRILDQFAPFGPENMRPTFVTRGVSDYGDARTMSEGKHLRMVVQKDGKKLPGVAFKQGDKFKAVASGAPVDIAYCIEKNTFRGNTTLQLNIKDIKVGSSDHDPSQLIGD